MNNDTDIQIAIELLSIRILVEAMNNYLMCDNAAVYAAPHRAGIDRERGKA